MKKPLICLALLFAASLPFLLHAAVNVVPATPQQVGPTDSPTFTGITLTGLDGLVEANGASAATVVTTSAGIANVITDESGTGFVAFTDSPVFTTKITTPSIIGASAIGITPAAGSNLNVTTSGAGNFVVNTTELVVDTGVGVGIGTAAPNTNLHVKTATGVAAPDIIKAGSATEASGSLAGYGFAVGGDQVAKASISLEAVNSWGRGDLVFLIDNTADTSEVTIADEKMRLTRTGNVGIGTTAPLAKLAINGGLNVGADADPGDNNLSVAGNTVVTGTLQIGGGTAIAQVYSATAVLDFGNTAAQTSTDLTITVTGAAVGDSVALGIPAAPDANACFTGWVSVADTVTVRFNNYSAGAIDPASGTYRATVTSF